MPDSMIQGAIVTLDEAIERQEALVAQVQALRTSNRKLKQFAAGLVTVTVLALVAVGYALAATGRANEAIDGLEEAGRARQAIIETVSVEACRARNAGFEAIRDKFDATFDALSAVLISNEGQVFVATLRAIPDPVDSDCNHDGTIGPDDYPQE